MFIKPRNSKRRGWTLVEMMIAVGVFSVGGAALMTLFVYSLRTFTGLSNYAVLDQENRKVMDKLTREVRSATKVTSYSTNPPSISIQDRDGNTVTYAFSSASQTLTRTVGGGSSEVLLTNCSLMNFYLYSRVPINGSFDAYPVATGAWSTSVKLIELTWKSSRSVGGSSIINSENIQTARIVVRNQQD